MGKELAYKDFGFPECKTISIIQLLWSSFGLGARYSQALLFDQKVQWGPGLWLVGFICPTESGVNCEASCSWPEDFGGSHCGVGHIL